MRALIYLIGLIAICVFVAWFGFGIQPQNQWDTLKGYVTNLSGKISSHVNETESSAGKLKNVLTDRFNEAADVYNGKEKEDPFKYNQPLD